MQLIFLCSLYTLLTNDATLSLEEQQANGFDDYIINKTTRQVNWHRLRLQLVCIIFQNGAPLLVLIQFSNTVEEMPN